MKQALEAWIAEEEERFQLTLEALAEVDAGNVIDHTRMLEWAEKLGTDTPASPP